MSQEIKQEICFWGRAPKKYGPRAYKVGHSGEVKQLESLGWKKVGLGTGYVYVESPTDLPARPKPIIVSRGLGPDQEEVKELVSQVHAKGEAAEGELQGWKWSYQPQHTEDNKVLKATPDGMREETESFTYGAHFSMGSLAAAGFDADGSLKHFHYSDVI